MGNIWSKIKLSKQERKGREEEGMEWERMEVRREGENWMEEGSVRNGRRKEWRKEDLVFKVDTSSRSTLRLISITTHVSLEITTHVSLEEGFFFFLPIQSFFQYLLLQYPLKSEWVVGTVTYHAKPLPVLLATLMGAGSSASCSTFDPAVSWWLRVAAAEADQSPSGASPMGESPKRHVVPGLGLT